MSGARGPEKRLKNAAHSSLIRVSWCLSDGGSGERRSRTEGSAEEQSGSWHLVKHQYRPNV